MEHGGRIFQVAEDLAIFPHEVLDFSANINAFFDLSAIQALIREYVDYIRFYPDPDLRQGHRALAGFLDIPKENIAIGNGETHLIHLMPQALRPQRVLIPVPTFSEYEKGVQRVGAEVSFFTLKEEEGFSLRAKPLLASLERSVDMVILCNPNNPTGQLMAMEELVEIERCVRKKGAWLVVDEAFLDFVPEEARPSLVEKAIDGRLIILRSLTKCLAVPGLRLGYLIAPGEVVKRIIDLTPAWSVNCFAQIVLENIRDLYRIFEEGLPQLFVERDFSAGELSRHFTVFPSKANFLLFKSTRLTATQLAEGLLQHRVMVRDCSTFRGLGQGFVRVAVRRREENMKLLEALQEVL